MKFEIDPVAFLKELRYKRTFGGMCACGEYQYGVMEVLDQVEKMLKSRYPEAFEEKNELNEGE